VNAQAAGAFLGLAAPPPGTATFFRIGYAVSAYQNVPDSFSELLKARPSLVVKDGPLSDRTFYGEPFSPHRDPALCNRASYVECREFIAQRT
jgi:hypothetical protein